MNPARLAIFFGRLSADLPDGPAEPQPLRLCVDRAISHSGLNNLRGLWGPEGPATEASVADAMERNPGVFGALEARTIAREAARTSLRDMSGPAADHYHRLAKADGAALVTVLYPAMAVAALLAAATVLSICGPPRFAQALAALDLPKPFLTRVVVVASVWFRVLVQPVLLSAALVLGVLVLYWRTPEGRDRLSRLALRLPGVGAAFELWASARMALQAGFCHRLGTHPREAVEQAGAATVCPELPRLLAGGDDGPSARPRACLRSALDDHDHPDWAAHACAEADLCQRQLDLLAARTVWAAHGLLLLGTVAMCTAAIWGAYLPVARLHDSILP